MNQTIRKTALLMGACSLLGLYSPAMAAAPETSVETVQQTTKKVTGTVSDATGPVMGASVVEKGNAGNGVITDLDGNFTINVKPGATLVVSYIGYVTQEIAVGNQSSINVTLAEDNSMLDEVVVVVGHLLVGGRKLHIVAVLEGEVRVVTDGHHDLEVLKGHLHALAEPCHVVYLARIEVDDVILPVLVARGGVGQILKVAFDDLLGRPGEEAEHAGIESDKPYPAPLPTGCQCSWPAACTP